MKSRKSSAPAAKATPPAPTVQGYGWAIGLLIFAVLVAYTNSLKGVWAYDDFASIGHNPTLRSWRTVLFPPEGGITVTGRPILNLSFALSYALSGDATWGHHLLNGLIHLAAGLALFGLVRRTLQLPALAARWGQPAPMIAFLTALLWLVHPLQTESVTYIVQRAESLMGLWFFLTFYAYARSVTAPQPVRWQIAAIVACLAGVGTKEVIVTAPLLILLHDRAFAAGSFRVAWEKRRWFYVGLFGTWLPLAALVLGAGNRGGSAGFGARADALSYWLTQFEAVVQYLRLSFWPHPLVFEYGTFWKSDFLIFVPCVVIVTALVLGTGWALVRRPGLGFLGAFFLCILAPTSVIPGTTQMIVEHRMYLPLASVLVLAVLGLWAWLGQRAILPLGIVAVIFTGLTVRRNMDYRDEVALWMDTLAKRPLNATAHDSLAVALAAAGRPDEALTYLGEAARLAPTRADYLTNYGTALSRAGRQPEALVEFQRALRLEPDYVLARINFGLALQRVGRTSEAIEQLEAGLRLNPSRYEAQSSLGSIFVDLGRLAEAIPHLEKAVQLAPDYPPARVNFGIALLQSERLTDALTQLQAALRLDPSVPETHNALGLVYLNLGRTSEAMAAFETAVRLRPDFRQAQANLDRLRGMLATPRP